MDYNWDDITWNPSTARASGGDYSMYMGDNGQYPLNSEDWLISPVINAGDACEVIWDMYYAVESGWDYMYLLWSPDLSYWNGYYFPFSAPAWYNFDYMAPDPANMIHPDGSCYVAFIFESDGSIVDEGMYIDNVEIKGSAAIYSETVDTVLNGAVTQTVTFPDVSGVLEFDKDYVVQAAVQHPRDITSPNNELSLAFDTYVQVYNTRTGKAYGTIQAAIDDVETLDGDTIVARDGIYIEDVDIWKDLTVTGENPPTSTAVINGQVVITADGVTLQNFLIDPLTEFTASAAAVMVYASDVTIQDNIIRSVDGEVSSGYWTLKGIHVYGGVTPEITNIQILNNVIEDIHNDNFSIPAGVFFEENFDSYTDGYDFDGTAACGFWDQENYGTICYSTYNYAEVENYKSHSAPNSAEIYYNCPNDDWLVSPVIDLTSGVGCLLDFWYLWDDSWDIEFEVYVREVGDSWGMAEKYYFLPGTYPETWYMDTLDISAYDGKMIEIAWRYTSDDEWACYIDDVKVYSLGGGGAAYGGADGIMIQGNVTDVLIDGNTIQNVHSKGWCYGVELTPTATPPILGAYSTVLLTEDFEGTAVPSGWLNIDDDGDGYAWDCDWAYPLNGAQSAGSASYINGIGPLNPDNWLITPQIDLSGYGSADLTFWTKAQDGLYPADQIEVWVSDSGDDVSDFTDKIFEFTETSTTPKEHIVDLSSYGGDQIYVAFRHTDSYDMYWIILDDIEITAEAGGGGGGAVPPGPYPRNVEVTCNVFKHIGDYTYYDEQAWPGVCLTIDETYPGADDGMAGSIDVHCNYFDYNLYAIVNKDTDRVLEAEYNFYGDPSGPGGGAIDPDDGTVADGFGADIIDLGLVNFAPFLGVNPMISIPAGDISVEVGEPVLFDAGDSFAYVFEECCDPIEGHMQYEWDFGDGFYSHNPRTTHVFTSAGTYVVRLMIDTPGFELFPGIMFGFDYVTVTVVPEGSPLAANADGGNLGGYEGVIGEDIQFFGTATGGTGRYFYSWDFGNGDTSYEKNPVYAYKEDGEYTVTLRVTDSTGTQVTDTSTVIIYGIDELFVSIQGTYAYAEGDTITFTGTVGGGQGPYNYNWNFGDGIFSTEQNPQHVYENSGTYTVTLTVTDGLGTSKTTSKPVTVTEASGTSEIEITDVSGGFLLSATINSDEAFDWSIDVDGMVFFGGHAEDYSLGSTEIKLPFTLGFGNVDITIVAGGTTETYSAFMLGPFVLNLA
jgi:PKD repeat protein